jgi:hypothetical protein
MANLGNERKKVDKKWVSVDYRVMYSDRDAPLAKSDKHGRIRRSRKSEDICTTGDTISEGWTPIDLECIEWSIGSID